MDEKLDILKTHFLKNSLPSPMVVIKAQLSPIWQTWTRIFLNSSDLCYMDLAGHMYESELPGHMVQSSQPDLFTPLSLIYTHR